MPKPSRSRFFDRRAALRARGDGTLQAAEVRCPRALQAVLADRRRDDDLAAHHRDAVASARREAVPDEAPMPRSHGTDQTVKFIIRILRLRWVFSACCAVCVVYDKPLVIVHIVELFFCLI